MGIPAWELAVMLREIVINCNCNNSKSVANYQDLREIINRIKDLDNETSTQASGDVLLKLHNIAHLQFAWQRPTDLNVLVRHLKIYNSDLLRELILEKLGFSAIELMALGLLLNNHFSDSPTLNISSFAGGYPNNKRAIYTFLQKLTIDINTLRAALKNDQQYDERWIYTWNPLELTPLITLQKDNSNLIYCPFPELLYRRLAEGVYFDIVESSGKFSKSFGDAFQEYVGDVLKEVFRHPDYDVIAEESFMIGKNVNHGIDWILSDAKANIFIECKTKRLKLNSKIDLESEDLNKDLEAISEAVKQTYKNIDVARKGLSNWNVNKGKIYPMVITLEDWFLISPPLRESINERVKQKLKSSDLPLTYLEDMPYTISSISSFEKASYSIFENGIENFMSLKVASEYSGWDLKEFARDKFPTKNKKSNIIFDKELKIFKQEVSTLFT